MIMMTCYEILKLTLAVQPLNTGHSAAISGQSHNRPSSPSITEREADDLCHIHGVAIEAGA